MSRVSTGPHLYLAGKVWRYRFQVHGRRADRSTGEADQGIALGKAVAAWQEAHARQGLPVPRFPNRQELTDLAASWLLEIERRADEKHATYKDTCEQHVTDYVLRRWSRPEEINTATWDQAVRDYHAQGVGWATLQRATVSVRAFLRYCESAGAIEEAPILHAPARKLAEREKRYRRPLTTAERNRVWSKLEGEARRWYIVAYLTAMRRGAQAAMTRRWVDFRRHAIRIPPARSKSGAEAWIDLPPKAERAIREQLAARGDISPDAPIWTQVSHRKAWKRALEAAGIDPRGVTPHHTARHTRLTQIGEHGDLVSVMSQAGHLSPQTAQRYLHASLAAARRANRRAP